MTDLLEKCAVSLTQLRLSAGDKARGYKKSLTVTGVLSLLTLSGFLITNLVFAAATVTPASHGTNISIDTTSAAGGSESYRTLSGPSITENAPGDIAVGTHTITLPAGWEFNTASTVTVVRTV